MKLFARIVFRRLLLAIASAGPACPALALQPLVTDDAGTQGRGGNQIEFSLDLERAREEEDSTHTRAIVFTYTRGITDSVDAFFEASNVRVRSDPLPPTSGNGNPVIGAKWRFLEAGTTSLAFKPEVLLPVSRARETRGLGNGRISAALTLVASHEVGLGEMHANVGVARDRFDEPATPAGTTRLASVAAVWNVAARWKLALDLGYEAEKAGGIKTTSRFAGLGVIHLPVESIELALGVFRSTDTAQPRARTKSATVGVTWSFP
jgi:hypothetical protein